MVLILAVWVVGLMIQPVKSFKWFWFRSFKGEEPPGVLLLLFVFIALRGFSLWRDGSVWSLCRAELGVGEKMR